MNYYIYRNHDIANDGWPCSTGTFALNSPFPSRGAGKDGAINECLGVPFEDWR